MANSDLRWGFVCWREVTEAASTMQFLQRIAKRWKNASLARAWSQWSHCQP